MRRLSLLLCSGLLLSLGTASLRAQATVGYAPTASPYHGILHGTWLEAYDGHIFGTGGALLVGPRDGAVRGLRFDLRGKNTLELGLGGWYASTIRSVVDANDSVATRVKGPFSQRLIAFEGDVQLNLTGGKTWHALAPYAEASFGLVNGERPPPSDTSGYTFGTKLYFGPVVGSRLFLGQRVFIKAEAQLLFWNLSYPGTYDLEPSKQPGTPTHPNAVNTTGSDTQYTLTPTLRFGLGISF
ncbi:MAG TPA: hypothetical protein VHW65_02030 [Gemmatimonadales bacterium]|jgi:hypothetical protein|nr:hypothetical protein [Gemmatimonadales bacterium]